MIRGIVDDNYDAQVPLKIIGEGAEMHQIEAVIDTGFNGFLTLPPLLIAELEIQLIGVGRAILADGEERLFPLYEVTVSWDGQPCTVEADAADTDPLVGMAMMDGYGLRIEVKRQGDVTLEKLTSN